MLILDQETTRQEVCDIASVMANGYSRLTYSPDRTSELRKKGYQGRRLGPVQMTTDTAVRVTRICVQDKGESSNRMLV